MGIMYKLMKHRHLAMDHNKTVQHFENVSNKKTDRNRLITIEGNIIEATASQTMDTEEDILSRSTDTNVEKQFTAEHIIQLCKFLAEKSKRNKNVYKQQQSPKKLNKSKQTQFQFQQMECDDYDNDNEEIEKEVDFYQNEALPLIKAQHQQQQQRIKYNNKSNEFEQHYEQKTTGILSSRLSPVINSLNISSNILTNSCASQHHQQQLLNQQQSHQHQMLNYQHQQQHEEQQQHNQGKRDILLKIRRQIFERKRLRESGAFEDPQFINNTQVWRPW